MSTVQELFARLHASGVRLALSSEGKLKVSPPGGLPPELLDTLKRHKSEILALLSQHQESTACSFCGTTEGIWVLNKGTCWERTICRYCQGRSTMPTQHNCDPSLPLEVPCWGQQQPVADIRTCSSCGQAVPLTETDESERKLFVCPGCGSFAIVPKEPGKLAPATSQPTPFSDNALQERYRQAAASVKEDCLTLDPHWLLEHYPRLWQRLALIDLQLTKMEQRAAEPAEYEAMLERLTETVRQARELFEQESQQKNEQEVVQ